MDFNLPQLGEGVYEAEFVSWLVKPGQSVKSGQGLFEVLTDKASMEVPAPFAGVISTLEVQPGSKLKIGDRVLTYTPAGVPVASTTTPAAAPAAKPEKPANGTTPAVPVRTGFKASPSVRQLARKLGIDPATVQGSGPGGRILVEDLAPRVKPATVEAKKPVPKPADQGRPGTRVKLAGLRRTIAEHMVISKKTIPDYSYIDECDVTALVALREQLRTHFEKKGTKLTYLAFLVKAVTAALKEVPIVNSSLDEATQEIVLHERCNIGIAVSTPAGLIVPVIHDADRLGVGRIAQEIERLSSAARAGKVKLEEVRGGTFTITSTGNLGGLISTPVINHPEVGILGIGKIVKRPVYDAEGNIRPADIAYLSFTFDHRVIDGAVGAVFSNAVIERLKEPALMLMD